VLYWLRFLASLSCLLGLFGVAIIFTSHLLWSSRRRSGWRTRYARPAATRPPGTTVPREPLGTAPATKAASRSPLPPGVVGLDTWSRHVDTLTPTVHLHEYRQRSRNTVSTTTDDGDASGTPTCGRTDRECPPLLLKTGRALPPRLSGHMPSALGDVAPALVADDRDSTALTPYQRAILDYESAS